MFKILSISDIQGNLNAFQELYESQDKVDFIIHTGNFGFWNNDTIEDYNELAYLKQIVAFLEVLDKRLVEELNDFSIISNHKLLTLDQYNELKAKLDGNAISQLDLYLSGELKLPCPVYTIFGPLDDPKIVDKFQSGEYVVPNLFVIDHTQNYEVETPLGQPNIKLYGLGGSLKIHSLFDNGNLDYPNLSGKIGELWITLIQIAEFYSNFVKTNSSNTINIFIAHAPVIKTPLLEHLAILTNSDFTISQGLHFRYPVMGNGMSFVDSMGGSAGYIENYRSKFSRLRMILGELWLIIKEDLVEILDDDVGKGEKDGRDQDQGKDQDYEGPRSEKSELYQSIELGLSLFDKIPISVNDSGEKIVCLSLNDENEDLEANKKILKKINDYYFQAYYNLWHFNLCDHKSGGNEYNFMVFRLDEEGNFKLHHCNSQGFNFKFKVQDEEEEEEYEEDKKSKFNAIEYTPKTGVKKQILYSDYNEDEDEEEDDNNDDRSKSYGGRFFRGSSRGRGKGRGRGRGFRGRSRGRAPRG